MLLEINKAWSESTQSMEFGRNVKVYFAIVQEILCLLNGVLFLTHEKNN